MAIRKMTTVLGPKSGLNIFHLPKNSNFRANFKKLRLFFKKFSDVIIRFKYKCYWSHWSKSDEKSDEKVVVNNDHIPFIAVDLIL